MGALTRQARLDLRRRGLPLLTLGFQRLQLALDDLPGNAVALFALGVAAGELTLLALALRHLAPRFL
ncbi:MAG TPA: hypothetical protein VKC57_12970 [Ktedonobacterales bacterium]|nr:hypothetical protein [Ktedonobacterales bacterium]